MKKSRLPALTGLLAHSKNRRIRLVSLLLAGLSICIDTTSAIPGAIISPGTLHSISGPGSGNIADTFNQSGLSAGFTSGVTDFDTYIASLPGHSRTTGEWFSEAGAGSSFEVTYDFGSEINIDRLALWNEEGAGIGKFDLLAAGEDLIFTEFATDLMPTDHSAGAGPDYLADVFAFTSVTARYIRFNITDSPQPLNDYDGTSIGEVAFRLESTRAVPDSGSTLMLLTGALGTLGWFKRGFRRARPYVN